MKTTIYFYTDSGSNGLLMRQGDKYINLGNFAPTGIFDDIPNHPVDLYPNHCFGDEAARAVVPQLKAAYASVADEHIMYDFDDMLTDYVDRFDVLDWNSQQGWDGQCYPIATIDGSCGTIEILENPPEQEQFELEPSPEVMADEVVTQSMLGL